MVKLISLLVENNDSPTGNKSSLKMLQQLGPFSYYVLTYSGMALYELYDQTKIPYI